MAEPAGITQKETVKSSVKPAGQPVKRKVLVSIQRSATIVDQTQDQLSESSLFEQHARVRRVLRTVASTRSPLQTRAESRFGHDFSRVKAATVTPRAVAQARLAESELCTPETTGDQYDERASWVVEQKTSRIAAPLSQTSIRGLFVQRQEEAEAAKKPGAEYEEYARRLKEAMEGWGTEEEQIFRVLQQVHGRTTAIDSLKASYERLYGANLLEQLRDELSGSELDLALTMLGEKPSSREVEIKPRAFSPAEYSAAVDRLEDAMRGGGTDEDKIFAVLMPFAGAFDSVEQLKTAYRSDVGRSLEGDLRDEMSGDELEYALKLLHEPVTPAKGMAEQVVAEAEQGNVGAGPGGPCTAVTIKRYVRAYISSRLGVRSLDEADKASLENLLGPELATHYLAGGPPTKPLEEGTQAQRTAASLNLYNNILNPTIAKLGLAESASHFVRLWNINISEAELEEGEVKWHGAASALEGQELADMVKHPVTGEENIKSAVWDEILKPGEIVQTWENANHTGRGHSFIFLEYVYSPQVSPPEHKPSSWVLYGASGRPLDTDGNQTTKRTTVTATYTVQKGADDATVLTQTGFSSLQECKEANKNNPKFKRGGGDAWFHEGAEIITKWGEEDVRSLEQMRGLHLVGMRITDQRGFVFIPKNSANTDPSSQVIPNDVKRQRAKWIGESVSWVAARPR